MDPLSAAASFFGGMTGSAPAVSSATAIAGSGEMTFGKKPNNVLIIAVAVTAIVIVALFKRT